jgi:ferric-dicitrate binding protein FerR (iron transport regulator)
MKGKNMEIDQDNIIRLIIAYLTETASEEEKTSLEKWIRLNTENKVYFQRLKNIWEASDKRFSPSQIVSEQAFKKVLNEISKKEKKNSFFLYFQKIAAILLLPLIVTNLFLFVYQDKKVENKLQNVVYNEVFANFGTRSSLKLSDGSKVWINSGSSFRYPDKFTANERTVYLKGEAYFEVQSDTTKPFIVQTQLVNVKATGTKFNVLSFSDSSNVEVTLASGKVSVTESGSVDNSGIISELKPNQHLSYNSHSKKPVVQDVDTYSYIAWKDGKMVFRNEPMSNVVKKISQVFNVDIELKGKELQNYRYRATFQDETLGEILKLLKLTAPIDYTELKREEREDGSFSKKKIIIFQILK